MPDPSELAQTIRRRGPSHLQCGQRDGEIHLRQSRPVPGIDFFNGLLINSPADSAQPGWSGEPGRRIPHIQRALVRDLIEVDFGLRFADNVSAHAHRGILGKGEPAMPTKKLNKRARQLKKGRRLESTKPLTTSLHSATNNGVHISTATLQT